MAGRALILQHARASIGSVPEWAAARGFEPEILLAEEEWSPPDVAGFEFVVSMGSAAHAYDDSVPWLAREYEILAAAEASATPVLGICFGSQSLAIARGGEVRPASEHEVDWLEVETLAPELIAPGPWLFWHEDSFALPPGAELLARTPVGPAAYRIDRSLAVQFHPEATAAAMDDWLGTYREMLEPAVIERLRRGFEAEAEPIVARAYALYDIFLELAGIRPAPRPTGS